ncbi:hypothetical protein KUL97_04415 [Synechococcus sp. HK05]|uniref:hypothetical protein n=1 Tax=Synechococcus sp. HK05 TaxID=2725975 RepID=UPI001C381DD2|nr:hypothetical protein [Synechococcus sp. HK05]MBV2350953.1 hypothetical protein [Synechococcus sp. HK05]
MGLPTGLIQIKGRKGYYLNITVPHKLRKIIGKAAIQKKAADTLEAAKTVLAEEQVAANKLLAKVKAELTETADLRTRFQEWKQAYARADNREDDGLLTAEEALEIEIDRRVWLKENPQNHGNHS